MSYVSLDGKISSADASCRKPLAVAMQSTPTQIVGTGSGKKSKSRHLLFSRRRKKYQGDASKNHVSDTNSTASFSSLDDSLASFPNNSSQSPSGALCRVGIENADNAPLCINAVPDQFRRPPLPRGIRDHRLATSAHHQSQLSLSLQHCRQREERAPSALSNDTVRTQGFLPPQVAHGPVLVYPQRPVLNMDALEGERGQLHRHLQTIPSGEWLDIKSTCTGSEELSQTSRSSYSRSVTSPSVITGNLQHRTHIEETSTLDGHEAVNCIEVSVTTNFSDHEERSAGPVDIDDFIPSNSYWATDDHEIVLDEVEICRGLAGYVAGFEPEIIHDLSQIGQWNEHVVEEEEENDELEEASKYRKLKRASSAAAAPNSLHGHRRCQSLPKSAAEC